MPIRWKITLSAVLAVSLGLTIAGWVALRSIERLELAGLTDTLAARTSLAALSLQPVLEQTGRATDTRTALIQGMVRTLSRHAGARITVIGQDGTVLADSETADEAVPRLENHRDRPEVAAALAQRGGTDIRMSQTVGRRMFYLAIPVISEEKALLGVVRLAIPMTAVDTKIRDLQGVIGIAFGVALLVAVVLSVLLARGLTRPLSDMAAVARRLAGGGLGERVATQSRDEVGVLGATLNQMAERLESTIREVSEDRAQLLAVLTSMVEGVMVLDCRGKILQVNPALERMFLIRGTEARGRSHWEVVRHTEFNELIKHVLATRQNRSGEITLTSSGRMFRVEATVAGCQRENEACAVLVLHDVTTLRHLEKVRKDFVANVSHELRTPLTSIKGYVEALVDGVKDDSKETARFLDIILKQSDRLNLILEDLLQLSQIESGQAVFKREPIGLNVVVERTLALIKPLADKKGHRVTVAVLPDLPPVLGDEGRLVQVLTNLLDNAVKYTPERGWIHVAARRMPSDQTASHEQVELSVSDNGLGIPEADRPRVFERFYRVDKARSRELGGTGLGLAIVKHIVEGHGGQIWVEGNQPVGSRFVIRLPAAREM
ncbi:MAG: HAMP domain-containing protein [Nitrospiraceae bacterium]|nr:HAMP domain-containing protein [Nitrospiraceae bacterium]